MNKSNAFSASSLVSACQMLWIAALAFGCDSLGRQLSTFIVLCCQHRCWRVVGHRSSSLRCPLWTPDRADQGRHEHKAACGYRYQRSPGPLVYHCRSLRLRASDQRQCKQRHSSGIVVCHCDVSEIITQRESIHVINKAAAVPKSPDNGHTKARMFN